MKTRIFLLLLFACSNAYAQSSNLYFLSIGNGHYQFDENDTNYSQRQIPAAVTSAKTVYQVLNKYGTGQSLMSDDFDFFLYKKLILSRVAALFDKAFEGSQSTIIIYYSGHGQSDFLGNQYFVPGNVNKSTFLGLDQKSIIESYISHYDIEALYFDKLLEHISAGKINLGVDRGVANAFFLRIMQLGMSQSIAIATGDTGIDRQLNVFIKTDESQKILNKLPKLFIFADCCYEKFSIDKKTFRTYQDNIINYLTNMQPFESDTEGDEDEGDEDEKEEEVPASLTFSLLAGKAKLFELAGGKVLFSTGSNMPTFPVSHPYSKEKEVTPIARRLLIFFHSNPTSFTPYELLSKMTDKQFDSKTGQFYFKTVPTLQSSLVISQTTVLNDSEKLNFKINLK